MLWRVHIERKVCAPAVIIIEIACECSLQVPFIQYDDVVQTLPSNRADDPFRVRVLPGTPGGNQHLFYAHVLHPLLEVGAIHLVSIAKEILGCRIAWKCLHDLLGGPLSRWVLGHIKMDEAAAMMGEHDQDEEYLEPDRGYDKEVDGHQVPHMVFQKRSPGRRGWIGGAQAILIHGGLGHLDAEFSELTDNPGRAPARISFGDSANQISDFLRNLRPAWLAALAEPSPMVTKPPLLPLGDGPWLNED